MDCAVLLGTLDLQIIYYLLTMYQLKEIITRQPLGKTTANSAFVRNIFGNTQVSGILFEHLSS